ncbi:MAG TPA: dihydrofolate reductase family protein [Acidimicrobiales bacterium]|nr:dihydrofolate reductase family protein [Acidimicrobiales bacterium]
MPQVLTHMCMSLDGFVAQPDDNPAELFDWYWRGEVEVRSAQETMSFSVDAASAPMLAELISGCGAIVAGRRLFDQANGWGDNHPAGGPVVVVTHRPPPEDAVERFPRTTFTGSVEEAIATAKQMAGERFVTIASASIIQQALNLDLVDEVCVSLVPVLFGTGIRYFGELVGGHVMLEDPLVIQGSRALHLRYPVRR